MSLHNQTLFLNNLDNEEASEYLYSNEFMPDVDSIEIIYNPEYLQRLKNIVKRNKLTQAQIPYSTIKDDDLKITITNKGPQFIYDSIEIIIFRDEIFIKFISNDEEYYEISIDNAINYYEKTSNDRKVS